MVPNVHSELSEPNYRGTDKIGMSGGQNHLQGPALEKLDWQDSSAHIEEQKLQLLKFDSSDFQSSASVGSERRDGTGQSVDVMSTEDTANGLTQRGLQIEDTEHISLPDFSEEHNEQSENGLSNNSNYLEGNIVDDVQWNESAALEGEQQVGFENEGSDRLPTNVEWRNSTGERLDVNNASATANEWPQIVLENDDGGNSHLQEVPELWQEDGRYQEAVENWLGGPSDHEGSPDGRSHGIYFPDDDNVCSEELRELLSRYINITREPCFL